MASGKSIALFRSLAIFAVLFHCLVLTGPAYTQGNSPVCASDKPAVDTAYVSIPYSVNFTGTDADSEALLTLSSFRAPLNSTFSPAAGTTSTTPLISTFEWIPSEAERGTTRSFFVKFKDMTGLQGICSVSLQVSLLDASVTCSQIDILADLFAMDGNALTQRQLALTAAKKLLGIKAASKKEYRDLKNEAQKLYVQAWTSAWSLPSSILDCGGSEFCTEVSTTIITIGYVNVVNQLSALTNSIGSRIEAGGQLKQAKNLKKASISKLKASLKAVAKIPNSQSVCRGLVPQIRP